MSERPLPPRWIPQSLARRFEARPVAAAVLQNASWLVSERLVQMAIGFLISAWFVRYLGPEEFGRYSYALSFAGLFSSVASLGMDSVIVRDLARQPADEGEILGTALRLRLAAGLASWIACSLAVLAFRGDAPTRVLVAVVGANSVFLSAGVFDLWFQARIAARGVAIARTVINAFVQGLRAALILLAASATAFAALVPLSSALVAGATSVLYARRRAPGARPRWSTSRARSLARDSLPMLATALCVTVYLRIDQVMLASLCGDRENGLYAPAAALSELFAFVPIALSGSAFPVLVKTLDTLSPEECEARIQSFYDGMAAAGYFFAIALIALATPLVAALYGSAYERTAAVLQVHAGSFLFTTLGVARGRYLIAKNHLGFLFAASMLGAAVNVVLNLLLLPRHGAVGAAWATLLSYAVVNYGSGFLWRPTWRQTALITRAIALPLRLVARAAGQALRTAEPT